MTRRFWGLLCCGLMFVAAAAEAQTDDSHKSDLKVLFVGQDPARPFVNYEPTKRTTNLIKERTGAFAAFLRKHFEQVRVVHVEDYDPGMSASADVTVFDANPPKQ